MLSGRSPAVGRRLRLVEEDRSNLIASPTESEAGSLELYAENGNNDGIEFVPKTTRIGAINQVRKKSKIKRQNIKCLRSRRTKRMLQYRDN